MQTIAIISALRKELEPLFIDIQKKKQVAELNGITFYSGYLKGVSERIIFGSFGIGKVLASLSTQFLIDTFHPNHIYFIGACGGTMHGVKPGDVIVADSTIQSDFDITCFGYTKGEFQLDRDGILFKEFKTDISLVNWIKTDYICNFESIKNCMPSILSGRMISQDTFETKKMTFNRLQREFHFFGIDMESAAVNVVCHFNAVSFNVVKSAIDITGQLDLNFYRAYYPVVCTNAYKFLKTYLLSKNI
ncbi:5'-methylthioadenosine/S-adenosylhomocysteine nucleosidase [Candidatus Gottesmanbacteria bacterium]|nr:5'-methylthioadenosine/S-adenosylhomocysteine nucleosidase [Candidatus Gottesmanbacteria bacterium]